MTTTCPKCDYVRQLTDTAPDYECPKCGIIYAKFRRPAETHLSSSGSLTETPPSKRIARILIWVVLAVLGAGGATYAYTWKQEQDAIAERKKQRREEVAATRVSLAKLNDVSVRFVEALQLAGSTGRIALAGPVKDLQEIARDVKALEPVSCARFAHEALVLASQGAVDGFLAFMRGSAYERRASDELEVVADQLKVYREQVGLCVKTLDGV